MKLIVLLSSPAQLNKYWSLLVNIISEGYSPQIMIPPGTTAEEQRSNAFRYIIEEEDFDVVITEKTFVWMSNKGVYKEILLNDTTTPASLLAELKK